MLCYKTIFLRVDMKNKILILINLIFILVFGIIISINYCRQQAEYKITTIQPNEYHINLQQTYPINNVQLKALMKGQFSQAYYIFIGCPTNPYSRKLSPVVKQLSRRQTVYYFNTNRYPLHSELQKLICDKNHSKKDTYLIQIHHDKRYFIK